MPYIRSNIWEDFGNLQANAANSFGQLMLQQPYQRAQMAALAQQVALNQAKMAQMPLEAELTRAQTQHMGESAMTEKERQKYLQAETENINAKRELSALELLSRKLAQEEAAAGMLQNAFSRGFGFDTMTGMGNAYKDLAGIQAAGNNPEMGMALATGNPGFMYQHAGNTLFGVGQNPRIIGSGQQDVAPGASLVPATLGEQQPNIALTSPYTQHLGNLPQVQASMYAAWARNQLNPSFQKFQESTWNPFYNALPAAYRGEPTVVPQPVPRATVTPMPSYPQPPQQFAFPVPAPIPSYPFPADTGPRPWQEEAPASFEVPAPALPQLTPDMLAPQTNRAASGMEMPMPSISSEADRLKLDRGTLYIDTRDDKIHQKQ